jgi:signal transduction histidine kinase
VKKNGEKVPYYFTIVSTHIDDKTYYTGIGLDITERKSIEKALQKRVLALTKPLDDPESIQFTDLFNLEELQKLQDTFADATGVASIITYPDGVPITKPSNFCKLCKLISASSMGKKNCHQSDSFLGYQRSDGPVIQSCLGGGLWDAGASINIGGKHLANWLVGQVRDSSQKEDLILKYTEELEIDKEEAIQAFREVPCMSREKFEMIANSLFILASELSMKAYQNVQQSRFIAERNKAVSEMQELNQNLERMVSERTAQLEQSNQDLEAFAFSVSHDLKAPLRHVIGFASLMYSNIESPNASIINYYEKINIASKRMSSMIDELLTFSRLGRKELNLLPVDTELLINEVIEEYKQDYAHRDIEWIIESIPMVMGDKALLKIVFENLISNAIKYTSKKQKSIIEIGSKEGPENKLTIYIKDNGAGFDMAYANRLFGVFQRLHSSDEFEGIGIGLANVRRIILKHNGTITAEGKQNEGASFYITLSRAKGM